MTRRPTRQVPAAALRDMFNEGGYLDRVGSGLILEQYAQDFHPSQTLANEPWCTRSQLVNYIDLAQGRTVARVHQYLRMDGTLGASGKPDPKMLYVNGVIYELEEASYPFE